MPSTIHLRSPRTDMGSDQIADDILRAIRRILRRTAEHSRQLAHNGNLSVPQLLCLRVISESSSDAPATVAGIASQVQLSAATVSRILDRLDQAGLVTRQRSPDDRRKVFVSLTAQGRQRVKNLPTLLHEEFLNRLRRLKRPEQKQLLDSLQRIVDMMDASGLDAAPLLTTETEVKPPGQTS